MTHQLVPQRKMETQKQSNRIVTILDERFQIFLKQSSHVYTHTHRKENFIKHYCEQRQGFPHDLIKQI